MQIQEGCESTEEVITYMAGFDEQLTAFEANTKVEDCIHVIKMINYSFKCIPFFFFFYTSFNLKQSQEVCAEPVVLLV